jgi:hypothetical protein
MLPPRDFYKPAKEILWEMGNRHNNYMEANWERGPFSLALR